MTIVRLIRDSYPFLSGTEFVVTGGDDGFWTHNPFYSGSVFAKGRERRIAAGRDKCKLIKPEEYTGKVLLNVDFLNPKPMTEYEAYKEWINSPG